MPPFKPKARPPAKPAGAKLAATIARATGPLPQNAAPPPVADLSTVQVNFRVTRPTAKLIAELAREAGSTRRLIAQLLAKAGHKVDPLDLDPPNNRRSYD